MQVSPETVEQLRLFSQQFARGEPIAALRRQNPEITPNKVSLAALILGAALVCGSFYLLPRQTQRWGRRLVAQMIQSLRTVIQQRPPQQVAQWRARMARHILRLLQWMGTDTPKGLLSLVNFGYSIIVWHRLMAAQQLHDPVLVDVLHDMADALQDATPVLRFLHAEPTP